MYWRSTRPFFSPPPHNKKKKWSGHETTIRPLYADPVTFASLPNPLFILSDFNLPDINWAALTGSTLISNNFYECIFQSNLTQLVESPTHTHGKILDLVLTNCPEHITHLSVHPPEYQCITSDHYLIKTHDSVSCGPRSRRATP